MRILVLLICLLWSFSLSAEDEDLQWRTLGKDGPFTLLIGEKNPCQPAISVFINAESPLDFNRGNQGLLKLAALARMGLTFECMNFNEINLFGVSKNIALYRGQLKSTENWQLTESYYLWEDFVEKLKAQPTNVTTLNTASAFIIDTLGRVPDKSELSRFLQLQKLLVVHYQRLTQDPKALSAKIATLLSENKLDSIVSLMALAPSISSDNATVLFSVVDSAIENMFNQTNWPANYQSLVTQLADIELNSQSLFSSLNFIDKSVQNSVKPYLKTLNTTASIRSFKFLEGVKDALKISTKTLKSKGSSRFADLNEQIGVMVVETEEKIIQQYLTKLKNKEPQNYTELAPYFTAAVEQAVALEESGFSESATKLLASANKKIEQSLADSYNKFSADISQIKVNKSGAQKLIRLKFLLSEMENSYPTIAKYRQFVNQQLTAKKQQMCDSILNDAVSFIDRFTLDRQKRILINQDSIVSIESIVCMLFEKGHIVQSLTKSDFWSSGYALTITEFSGQVVTFSLSDNPNSQSEFIIKDIEDGDANDVLYDMVRQPFTGKPDRLGVTQCDKLASVPNDQNSKGTGWDIAEAYDDKRFNNALEACIAAVDYAPNSARSNYQLAKLVYFLGDVERTQQFNQVAVEQDYPAAIHLKAELLLASSDEHNTFVDAVNLFKVASSKGHPPATEFVKEFDDADLFYLIPAPSVAELKYAIDYSAKQQMAEADKKMAAMGLGKLSQMFSLDVSADKLTINECFQINADSFFCDYQLKPSCNVGGSSFLNLLAKASCATSQQEFDTFKKLSDGRWQWQKREEL